MAYVPPHMRKGTAVRSPTVPMPAPRGNHNFRPLGLKPNMDRSGKNVYADTAISRWFAVGPNGEETDFPSHVLQQFPMEHIEPMPSITPLALVKEGLLNESGHVSRDSSVKPWTYIAEKILQDLIHSSEVVRSEIEGEGQCSKEIKPKLVASIGKVLFLPRRPSIGEEESDTDSLCAASLKQLTRGFCPNIPASYMKGIMDDVVPNIGVEFEDLKDIYHVELSDKSFPEATIACKCRVVKEEKRLELYKIELNEIRHTVLDISCIEKNFDLRLMLSTKRTLTSLSDDEEESIRSLVSAAVLDPKSKGGLRWPLGRASSGGDRYRVIAVWHTISRVYGSPSMRLSVRDADKFAFSTSEGKATGEITVNLKGVILELLGKKVENDSLSDTLEDTLKLLWEHFLHSEL